MLFFRPILFILVGCSTALTAQTPAELISSFQQEHQIPGLFVGIHHESKSWMWSMGKQGISDPTQVSKNTLFELGSVSKTFTTLALAESIEHGVWNWGTTVTELDSTFQGTPVGQLTLLDLVTHRTGGMPLQVPDEIQNDEDFIRYLRQWKPELPGARSYANPSIGLAAWLVGRHAGNSYQTWMDTHHFKRWGFPQTYIEVPSNQMQRYATGTGSEGEERRVQKEYLWAEAYGVKSSGQDMMRYVKRLLNPDLVKNQSTFRKALLAQRTTYFKHPLFDQGILWEALPWPLSLDRWESTVMNTLDLIPMTEEVNAQTAGRMYQKTGSTGGFSTYVVWIPEASWGMVLLANKYVPNRERVKLAKKLTEVLVNNKEK